MSDHYSDYPECTDNCDGLEQAAREKRTLKAENARLRAERDEVWQAFCRTRKCEKCWHVYVCPSDGVPCPHCLLEGLRAKLEAASKFPDDSPARPQETDETELWAEYVDWLERIYVAQNLARGKVEADLAELRDDLGVTMSAERDLRAELAEARKDTRRLEWIYGEEANADESRAKTDAAMEGEGDG